MTLLWSQALANKVFDIGVNQGIATSIKVLQQALAVFYPHNPVVVDGLLGAETARLAGGVPDVRLMSIDPAVSLRKPRPQLRHSAQMGRRQIRGYPSKMLSRLQQAGRNDHSGIAARRGGGLGVGD